MGLFQKGSFTNYVYKILAFSDHIPPYIDIFYSIKADKKWIWLDHLPDTLLAELFWGAVNHCNQKNWVPFILIQNLWLVFMETKQKIFFSRKQFKMAASKKLRFSKSPILIIFLWKFHGLVLGLVGLIDAKGIDVA